jgi:hypothetical protein
MRNVLALAERPTRLQADGAFFVAPRGGRLVVKDAVVTSPKRQFEPGSPRQLSGTVPVAAVAAPDRQPRDCAPWYPTVANITAMARNFHSAAQSPNATDCARHELLPRDNQIEIIAALSEGMSIRSVERLTGVHRDTIMRLGARVGRGCAELHDRMMVGLRVPRIECDELWQYVGCKQKRVTKANIAVRGDQYTFVALAASTKGSLRNYRGT